MGGAGGGQRGLDRAGGVGGAGEDQHLAGWGSGRELVGHQAGDPVGLVGVGGEGAGGDPSAATALCGQRLLGAGGVVGDAGGRGGGGLGGGAGGWGPGGPAVRRGPGGGRPRGGAPGWGGGGGPL